MRQMTVARLRDTLAPYADLGVYMWWPDGTSNPNMPYVESAVLLDGRCILCFGEDDVDLEQDWPEVFVPAILEQLAEMPDTSPVFFDWNHGSGDKLGTELMQCEDTGEVSVKSHITAVVLTGAG
jgi:hypothetical protein